MSRHARMICWTVLSLLSVGVAGAGLAWACTPPGFGTPAEPEAPPSAAGKAVVAPPAAAPAEGAAPATDPAPADTGVAQVAVPVEAAATSASTSGAVPQRSQSRGTTSRQTSGAGSKSPLKATASKPVPAAAPKPAVAPVVAAAPAVAAAKPTAAAPRQARPENNGAARAKASTPSAKQPAATPTQASATDDVWSGVSGQPSPMATAEASGGGQGDGFGTAVTLGLAILGLGMAGLTGGFLVMAVRRRRSATAR